MYNCGDTLNIWIETLGVSGHRVFQIKANIYIYIYFLQFQEIFIHPFYKS